MANYKTILQIVVEGNTGSTGTIAETIGNYIIKERWVSYIAHGRFPRKSNSRLIKIGNNIDLLFHGLITRFFDMHGLGSKRATKKFIKEIEKIKPDIIHLHHIHGYYINWTILFKFLKKSNIPVVWTFHDCWAFTGHCCHFDYIECDKWIKGCYHCPQIREYPKSFIIDRSKKNYNQKKHFFTSLNNLNIVSVSNWLDNLVAKSFFKNTNHLFIYNGIDTDLFKPTNDNNRFRQHKGIDNKFIILGVATTWNNRKGLDDFIQLSKFLKHDEVIVLVGLKKSQIEKLPNNIIGLTRTENRQELSKIYSTANVFVNLSVEETFGLTTAESMSCGTPVIVYNSTASPELICNQTGIVIPKNNILKLVEAISIIKDKEKLQYSNHCRARALELFNQSNNIEKYINLYKSILNIS